MILIKKHSQNYLTDSHEILPSQTAPLDPSRRKVSSLRLLPFKSYDGEKKFKSSLVSYVTSSFISGSRPARAHWLSNRNPQPPSCYADGRTFRRFFELIFNSPSFILKNTLIRMNHILEMEQNKLFLLYFLDLIHSD